MGGGAAEEQNEVVEERNVNGGKEKGENSSLLRLTDHNIFIILYGVFAVYFAGVMVRLMLVLAPVMCILSGIAVSSSLSTYMKVGGTL